MTWKQFQLLIYLHLAIKTITNVICRAGETFELPFNLLLNLSRCMNMSQRIICSFSAGTSWCLGVICLKCLRSAEILVTGHFSINQLVPSTFGLDLNQRVWTWFYLWHVGTALANENVSRVYNLWWCGINYAFVWGKLSFVLHVSLLFCHLHWKEIDFCLHVWIFQS